MQQPPWVQVLLLLLLHKLGHFCDAMLPLFDI
jgi:hypothetical protein